MNMDGNGYQEVFELIYSDESTIPSKKRYWKAYMKARFQARLEEGFAFWSKMNPTIKIHRDDHL